MMACRMCDNAHTNPELHSDNDLSYISIGRGDNSHRMFIRSGDDRPTEILFEELYDNAGWELVGYYQPKYCPNCGRELMENQKKRSDDC